MTCQCSSNTNGPIGPIGGGNTGTNTGFLMMGGSGGRKKSRVRRKKSSCCNGKCKCKCKMCKKTRRRKRIRACTKKRCRRNNCTRRCCSGKGKINRNKNKNKNMKGGGPSILGDLGTNPSYFMHKLVGTPYETPVNNLNPTGYYI